MIHCGCLKGGGGGGGGRRDTHTVLVLYLVVGAFRCAIQFLIFKCKFPPPFLDMVFNFINHVDLAHVKNNTAVLVARQQSHELECHWLFRSIHQSHMHHVA